MSKFCYARDNFLEKKALGWSLGETPCHCDSTDLVNTCLSWWNASLAVGDQDRDLGILRSMEVRGDDRVLKFAMKQ